MLSLHSFDTSRYQTQQFYMVFCQPLPWPYLRLEGDTGVDSEPVLETWIVKVNDMFPYISSLQSTPSFHSFIIYYLSVHS